MPDEIFIRGTIVAGNTGHYIIKETIDRGGVGTVFLGQRVSDRIEVAIKALHGGRFPITDVAKMRFRKEITILQKLNHPNIVHYYDSGIYEGRDFIVMEFLNGGTVSRRIHLKDYSDSTAFKWCAELLNGLEYLHINNCVHRDLKPNNLLLAGNGTLKIGDMGILRDITPEAYLTMSGDQIGSVLYISRNQREHPEQAGPADDAYSAACCFYEILSRQRIHVFPESLFNITQGSLPRYICDLIMGCLAGQDCEIAFSQLHDCFEIASNGEARLSRIAQSKLLNDDIILLPTGHPNKGVVRRQIAESAPLQLLGSLKLDDHGRNHLCFLDETKIMAVSSNDDLGPIKIRLIKNALNGLQAEDEFEVIASARGMALLESNTIVLAGRSGVSSYILQNGLTPVLIHQWEEHLLGRNFYALDFDKHFDRSLIVITSHGDRPVILDPIHGKFFKANSVDVPENLYYPSVCFLGKDRIALWTGEEISIVRFDFENQKDEIVKKIPFTTEVLSLAGTAQGDRLFIGNIAGLSCIHLSDYSKSWALSPPAGTIANFRTPDTLP
jgi:serine/threonine protein kinase